MASPPCVMKLAAPVRDGPQHRLALHQHPLDHDAAGADERTVLDDHRPRAGGLEDAADAGPHHHHIRCRIGLHRGMLAVALRHRVMESLSASALAPWLQRRLGVELRAITPVAGGCIHRSWRLQLADGSRLFAKSNRADQLPLLAPGWEEREAPDGPLHHAIRALLSEQGASFWGQLRAAAPGATSPSLTPQGASRRSGLSKRHCLSSTSWGTPVSSAVHTIATGTRGSINRDNAHRTPLTIRLPWAVRWLCGAQKSTRPAPIRFSVTIGVPLRTRS
mgnify:CR=1 FL=1